MALGCLSEWVWGQIPFINIYYYLHPFDNLRLSTPYLVYVFCTMGQDQDNAAIFELATEILYNF